METTLFNFDANDIKMHVVYDMHLISKMSSSFNYVFDKLVALNFHKEIKPKSKVRLEKLKWDEGKNYDWYAFTCGKAKLIIRAYNTHFTIYTKLIITRNFNDVEFDASKFAAFTFYTNTRLAPDSDLYCDNKFLDLNAMFHEIVEHITSNNVHFLTNSSSFKMPKYCEVEKAFCSDETIFSYDCLIFCAEELSNKHLELFAENDMLDMVKQLTNKVGCEFTGDKKINRVVTEFSPHYSEPYYHGVGIETIDKNGKVEFHDVYRLSHWNYETVKNLLKTTI